MARYFGSKVGPRGRNYSNNGLLGSISDGLGFRVKGRLINWSPRGDTICGKAINMSAVCEG